MAETNERGSARTGPESTVEFLGGEPNEVALFALAHRPTAYRPLTDSEVSTLRAAVRGALSPHLSNSIRQLLSSNAAATELVVGEQLLTAANRAELSPRLSSSVLGQLQPAANMAPRRTWSMLSWLYGGISLAAAAALTIAISFHGFNHPANPGFVVSFNGLNHSDNPGFAVARLDERDILAATGAGRAQPTTMVSASDQEERKGLKYVEVDVPRGLLAPFFADNQVGKRTEEKTGIAGLSAALKEKEKVYFIFDSAMKPLLTGDMNESLTIRVYDLSESDNKPLTSALHRTDSGKSYFVSF